jgi:hypothetical protein
VSDTFGVDRSSEMAPRVVVASATLRMQRGYAAEHYKRNKRQPIHLTRIRPNYLAFKDTFFGSNPITVMESRSQWGTC